MDVYRCKGVLYVRNSDELHTLQVILEIKCQELFIKLTHFLLQIGSEPLTICSPMPISIIIPVSFMMICFDNGTFCGLYQKGLNNLGIRLTTVMIAGG